VENHVIAAEPIGSPPGPRTRLGYLPPKNVVDEPRKKFGDTVSTGVEPPPNAPTETSACSIRATPFGNERRIPVRMKYNGLTPRLPALPRGRDPDLSVLRRRPRVPSSCQIALTSLVQTTTSAWPTSNSLRIVTWNVSRR